MVLRGRLTAGAVTALTAALLLSACSGQPGVAAVVDGRTITERQLDQVQDDLSVTQPVDTVQVLRSLLIERVINEGAADAGQAVSDAEAVSALQRAVAESGTGGGEDREYSQGAIDIVRSEIALTKIQGLPDGQQIVEQMVAEVQALDVELNPRYGTFDGETLAVVPDVLPWIVAPAS